MHDPRVLTGREVSLPPHTAREKMAPAPEIGFGKPVSDRSPRLLRDLELDRPPSLLLDHGPAVPHPATGAHVLDLQRDEIAAAQPAVDRELEQGKVALPTLQLKPDPDCPDIFRPERPLLADRWPLFQGTFVKPRMVGIVVYMVTPSIPTAPLPAPADYLGEPNVAEGRLFV